MAKTDSELREIAGDWGGLVAALGVLAGGGLLIYQGYRWLRYGEWPAYSGNDLIEFLGGDVSRITWVGLHRVIAWLADLSLALWLVAIGLLAYGLIMFFVEDHISDRRAKAISEQ